LPAIKNTPGIIGAAFYVLLSLLSMLSFAKLFIAVYPQVLQV